MEIDPINANANNASMVEVPVLGNNGSNPVSPNSAAANSDEDSRVGQQRKRKGERAEILCEDEDVSNFTSIKAVEDRRIALSTEEFVDAVVNLNKNKEYPCQDAVCKRIFTSIEEYNAHYMSKHMNKCSVCRKQLPGAHLLELHVLETHDTLFALMAERKPMFACLAEECPEKFMTAIERYGHFHNDHKHHQLFAAFKHFQNISQNSTGRHSPNKEPGKPMHKGGGKRKIDQSKIPVPGEDLDIEEKEGSMSLNVKEKGNDVKAQTQEDSQGPSDASVDPSIKTRTKGAKSKGSTKPDITFGHHGNKFRPWHSRSAQQSSGSVEKMDMSSIKDALELKDDGDENQVTTSS